MIMVLQLVVSKLTDRSLENLNYILYGFSFTASDVCNSCIFYTGCTELTESIVCVNSTRIDKVTILS